jgi:hypothetical protein
MHREFINLKKKITKKKTKKIFKKKFMKKIKQKEMKKFFDIAYLLLKFHLI